METLQYREIQRGKGIALALGYLVLVGTVLMLVFGFNAILDFTNSGGIRGKAFLIGLVVFAPLFLLVRLIYPKTNLEFGEDALRLVQKKETRTVLYTDIGGVVVNSPAPSQITLNGLGGEKLLLIRPFHANNLSQSFMQALERRMSFVKTSRKARMLNTTYDVLTYQRTSF